MQSAENGKSNIYLYDGSFAGFLSAVFEAWCDKNFLDIRACESLQPGFFDRYISVETDGRKAERIQQWLCKKISDTTESVIYDYFMSEAPKRERILYFYLRACGRYGRGVNAHLTDPGVLDFINAWKPFRREREKLMGFVRFRELEGNFLFSEISPEYNQLPFLGAFFFDRLTALPWMIYDSGRHKAALSDGTRWTVAERITVNSLSEKKDALDFETLWKNYLQALSIKERENKNLQRQMLPMKYRNFMTEFSQTIPFSEPSPEQEHK